MKLIGNIIGIIFGGFAIALEYCTMAITFCATIIGIPFGFQLLKIALLSLLPFGQEPTFKENEPSCINTIFNIIWIFTGGILIALTHLLFGILLAITIIGIPFAMQHFKLMKLAFTPFGRNVV